MQELDGGNRVLNQEPMVVEGEVPPYSVKTEDAPRQLNQSVTYLSLSEEQKILYGESLSRFRSLRQNARDFSKRKRASRKWLSKDQFTVLDALVHEHYDWEILDPLDLNCLAYACTHTFNHKVKTKSEELETLE